jgi:hypothetical protein
MHTQSCTGSRGARSIHRTAALVTIVASIFVTGCGGDSDAPSSPTRVNTPAPRLVQEGSFTLPAPEADGVYFALATMTDASSGKWEATVDWGNATNELWMWATNGACTVEEFSREDCPFDATCPCQFAVRSDVATPKPRVLTIPTAAAGPHSLIVVNLGPAEETASYRVTLTPATLVSGSTTGSPAIAAPLSTGRKALRRR